MGCFSGSGGGGPEVAASERLAEKIALLRARVDTRVQLGKTDEAVAIQKTIVKATGMLGAVAVVAAQIDLAELLMETSGGDQEKLSDALDTLIHASVSLMDHAALAHAPVDFATNFRLQVSLARGHKMLGEKHLPRTYLRCFHWGAAEDTYAGLAKTIVEGYGPQHRSLVVCYERLGALAADRGDLEKAEEYWMRAVKVKEGRDPDVTEPVESAGVAAVLLAVQELRESQVRERAAIRIQANYRGHRDRSTMAKVREDIAALRENPFATRQKLPYCRGCGVEQGGAHCAGCGSKLVYR
eukprot:TRINITY_DN32548_c0_g1_i1.p1 TRINITY_DN32548_c0_g1~~TRINITY_DN32548_c0_g1_i1.p1  ORF type:complete len:298 (+),score=83.26 TRINITY_DN32548_c0_g1_i1:50-943(+)